MSGAFSDVKSHFKYRLLFTNASFLSDDLRPICRDRFLFVWFFWYMKTSHTTKCVYFDEWKVQEFTSTWWERSCYTTSNGSELWKWGIWIKKSCFKPWNWNWKPFIDCYCFSDPTFSNPQVLWRLFTCAHAVSIRHLDLFSKSVAMETRKSLPFKEDVWLPPVAGEQIQWCVLSHTNLQCLLFKLLFWNHLNCSNRSAVFLFSCTQHCQMEKKLWCEKNTDSQMVVLNTSCDI